MKFITIDKKDWANGIGKSRKTYKLFGPVKDKNGFLIKSLEKDIMPEMDYPDSVMSAKSIIFPQTEKMLCTTLDESQEEHHIMKRVEMDNSPRAILGIRPYDAKAIQIVNLNFDTDDFRDPYWCDALNATTLIGLGINKPGPFDFSTSTGTGPFCEEGLDILMADLDDKYLAKILTDKGKAFMDVCEFEIKADEKESQALFDILRKEAEKNIKSHIDTDKLSEKTILELHDAPFWDDVAFSCINCGTCTFVCPTCWCFDIQDETKQKSSIRFRNWDTCMSSLFTRHATGHNPRATKTQRVRQRFMHKLKYFFDKYDQGIMCVGCGRCVKSCPVNIDIREVCNIMNTYKKQD
ncbi:MAG: 4Fe-4S dicluster domain-containing protein [Desulfobacula sp.]|uniref:4Fe-4S dicluster domain-containing protein n=1 Tax=Desulfobacula sp. TaxID=2593537 RepID=UPI001D9C9B58|nr:4Fe-4S dicluster domain-containing protein [Desulfobacula sp.]MBT3484414.1 4Fe-4S dicluster domain-containing protein [Desulfobacula sp.]MBT3803329.1 4Fe-4S dicluster domain-containing protein [Desulfobacula sp.]MBT4023705.1 4Fe-4S dicluster domain-containing protein [Desulfobacula sp.]MBT4197947.1 4Fe-4S dicluster domain-containing protein [Desulfobacula sp.]